MLFSKACELFVLDLTSRAWVHTVENKRRTLQVRWRRPACRPPAHAVQRTNAARRGQRTCARPSAPQRNDVATAISKTDMFDFLIDIVPREDPKAARRNEARVAQAREVLGPVAWSDKDGAGVGGRGLPRSAPAPSKKFRRTRGTVRLRYRPCPQLDARTGAVHPGDSPNYYFPVNMNVPSSYVCRASRRAAPGDSS